MTRTNWIKTATDEVVAYQALPATAERKQYLHRLLSPARGATSEVQFMAALAAMHWVQERFYGDATDGRRYLQRAARYFETAVARDKSLRVKQRDLWLVTGNFHARHGQPRLALSYYGKAADGETDLNRRALALVNAAKIELAGGYFAEALASLARIDLDKVSHPELQWALSLARVRILLTLGFDSAAVGDIKARRGQTATLRTNRIEHRYLSLMARSRLGDREIFAKRLGDFVAWVGTQGSDRVTAFYELETKLYQRILGSRAIVNRRRFLERVQYLSKQSGVRTFYKLAQAIDKVLAGRKQAESVTASLLVRLRELGRSEHQLVFQLVTVLLVEAMVARRRFDIAKDLLVMLQRHFAELESGFTPRAWAKLASHDSEIRTAMVRLARRIPAKVLAEDSGEQWLLAGMAS